MESFSPQGRRAPEPFSVRLREGASPHLRRGAMAALRLRLSLGAPKARLSQLCSILLYPLIEDEKKKEKK